MTRIALIITMLISAGASCSIPDCLLYVTHKTFWQSTVHSAVLTNTKAGRGSEPAATGSETHPPQNHLTTRLPDPDFIRSQIKDILAAPEYNRVFTHKLTAWDIIGRWLSDTLDKLVRGLLDPLGLERRIGRTMSIALAWVVIAAFVAMFLLGAIRISARHAQRGALNAAAKPEAALHTSARLLMEARELARSGDYRTAFLKAYLASIVYLDEIEVVRLHPSRTNWEYLRDLQNQGFDAYVNELLPLTHAFDRKFYGGEPSTDADYEDACRVFETLKERAAA